MIRNCDGGGGGGGGVHVYHVFKFSLSDCCH
jgi:hypothetical protein